MKTILRITIATIAAATAVQVSAQERTLPRHEFTLNGFGGLSTLNYSIDGADLSRGLAGGGGFGYHYFFSDRWALVTGVEAALYKASVKSSMMPSAQYFDLGQPNEFIMRHELAGFREKQQVWMLQVPVMAQWMAPVGAQKNNHFYLAGGVRLGFALSGKYTQSADGLVQKYISEREVMDPNLIVGNNIGGYNSRGSLSFKTFNAVASVETGFRWKLGAGTSLYTGVYLDYGLSNIATGGSGEALYMPANDANNHPAQTQNITHNSLLTAHRPDYGEMYEPQPGWNPMPRFVQNDERYTDKVRTIGAGIRIKIAFGAPKRRPAAPAEPLIIPPPVVREEPVEVPKVVEPPVVVEEPVREVPQEIKQSMMKLSNTLFAFDKWNLSDEAVVELDKVTAWLKDNPAIHVEIEGHTDNMGTADYNQRLSEDRARSVYNYFTEHGVDASRLSYKGYGLTQPVADNATAEGRRQNRRVELKIVDKK